MTTALKAFEILIYVLVGEVVVVAIMLTLEYLGVVRYGKGVKHIISIVWYIVLLSMIVIALLVLVASCMGFSS